MKGYKAKDRFLNKNQVQAIVHTLKTCNWALSEKKNLLPGGGGRGGGSNRHERKSSSTGTSLSFELEPSYLVAGY